MSFSALFTFDGGNSDGYEVINCNYSFGQATDEKGRPASDVRGGNIFVQVYASDDDAIMGWMIDPYKKASGSIVFKKTDQDSTLKELKFEDGYCVQYGESFSANNANAMTLSLTISAKSITLGNATHDNKW